MDPLEVVAIVLAGMGAGAINAIVGSGTLITFPVLIALGYPPVLANVSNCVGLVPGAASGIYGYRRELTGQRDRMFKLGGFSILGGLLGATLLLTLPSSAFDAIVPLLIATALVLVLIQTRLTVWLAHRRREGNESHPALQGLVLSTGVYGGYFGAAQGIILLAILGIAIPDDLQRLNGLKIVLSGLVNLTAGIFFVIFAELDWAVAGLIACGATVGGGLGARYGRRLPESALRALIVAVGTAAILKLLVFD